MRGIPAAAKLLTINSLCKRRIMEDRSESGDDEGNIWDKMKTGRESRKGKVGMGRGTHQGKGW